jgi:uncharacterized protein YjbJ (UPF0337 family)
MGAIIDKIKGKAKRAEGRLTGDKVRSTQGTVEEKKGDVGIKAGNAKARVRAGASRAKAKIERGVNRARAKTRTRAR